MSLLLPESPLIILPSLAVRIGLNEAIMLQQIHYWQQQSKNVRDGRQWVYNSVTQWAEQFPFWSKDTVKRTLTSLRRQEIVSVGCYNKDTRDKTLWYSINYDNSLLHNASGQSAPMEDCNMHLSDEGNLHQPLPEITTETTTDTEREPAREEATQEQLETLFNPSTDDRRKFTMSFDWRPDGDRIKARMQQMAIPILPPAEYRQSLIAFQNHFEASGLRQTESQWIAKLMSWIQGDIRNKQAKALSQPVQPSYKPFPKDD